MKRFFLSMSVAAFSLMVVSALGAQSPGRSRSIDGHSLLSPQRMKTLRNGKHHIHTVDGHHVHAVLKNGKVSRLHVTNAQGRQVPVRRTRGAGRGMVSIDNDPALLFAAQSGAIMVSFSFQISVNGQTISITINFPVESVTDDGDNE